MTQLFAALSTWLASSPALADTAANPTGGTLDEPLKTIGLFIGTYGLAVFLVIYYAIRLYPEIQKERGEWIRQITILRQLIDPGTRSLTRDQTSVVLQLVSDAFVDRLAMGGGGKAFRRESGGWVGPSDGTISRLELFGETIEFQPSSTTDEGLSNIYSDISRIIQDKKTANKGEIDQLFGFVEDYSKRDSYRLGQLRFGSATLEQIWRASYEPAVKEWKSSRPEYLLHFDRYDIDTARRFLSGHPAGKSKEEEFRKYFASLEFLTEQDIFKGFQVILNSKMEGQLARLASEGALV